MGCFHQLHFSVSDEVFKVAGVSEYCQNTRNDPLKEEGPRGARVPCHESLKLFLISAGQGNGFSELSEEYV